MAYGVKTYYERNVGEPTGALTRFLTLGLKTYYERNVGEPLGAESVFDQKIIREVLPSHITLGTLGTAVQH